MKHSLTKSSLYFEYVHPDYLKDTTTRFSFLNYLNQTFDVDCFPLELIKIERDNLMNLDIPIFHLNPYNKNVIAEGLSFSIIQESGVEAMKRRIINLNKETIYFQSDLIEKSIACFNKISDISSPCFSKSTSSKLIKNNNSANIPDKIKEHVINLAGDIIKNSFNINNTYQWIDIAVGRAGQWEVTTKKPGIYDGFDGIGLFYLYLYKVTKNEDYKELSNFLIKMSLAAFENFDPSKSYYLFSPYNYPFSTLYFLWHYQSIVGDLDVDINILFKTKLVPFVKNNTHADNNLDIANGAAGLLIFLVDYFEKTNLDSIEECIHLIQQHLVKSSMIDKEGICWNSYKFKGLIGFAHGNAGFLYALSKYYSIFSYSNRDIEYIQKIINYIQFNYIATTNNWLDLRYKEKRETMPSWCHGASGIILSYLNSLKILNLSCPSINWNKTLSLILNKGFDSQHCFCHGMIGNAEVAIAIGRYLNNDTVEKKIKTILLNETEIYNKGNSWKTGFTNGKYSLNGLMLGTSGIGYGLLKIFCDKDIPSILTLEPPKNSF